MAQEKNSAVKYQRTLFEPEHELFRESYRAFLDRHVAPYHDQWEKDKIVDRGVWLEAGKQGFLGMAVPEEYGGGGNPDFRYNTIVVEETVAGRYSGLGFSLHNDVVAPYLLRLTTEEQKQRWLPQFCSGEMITAIAGWPAKRTPFGPQALWGWRHYLWSSSPADAVRARSVRSHASVYSHFLYVDSDSTMS